MTVYRLDYLLSALQLERDYLNLTLLLYSFHLRIICDFVVIKRLIFIS
jgi:hypothetical protein